ncbi:MAG TPA: DUF6602 domain-containing protein [Nitrososphaera sp.]|nr:DUF6602 domain-containing protein [Nitrososphaera sp.]
MAKEKPTIFHELRDYFKHEADNLATTAAGTTIFSNNPDSGTVREDILLKFLQRHIPNRCEIIKGGFIFSANGSKSKQIDLMITNDLTMQFKKFNGEKLEKSFNCIEGCYCAISVKSDLDKNELIDSLENLESIPTITKDIIRNPSITNRRELLDQIPQRIIFAYKGISSETALKHLESYYKSKRVPDALRPDMIIVLNSYYFFKAGIKGVTLVDGTYIAPNTYGTVKDHKYVGAHALLQLLSRIQAISNIGSLLNFDLSDYFEQVDKTVDDK